MKLRDVREIIKFADCEMPSISGADLSALELHMKKMLYGREVDIIADYMQIVREDKCLDILSAAESCIHELLELQDEDK